MTVDPVSAEERAAAVNLAAGDQELRSLGVEPIVSVRRREKTDRHAVVMLHERQSGRSVVVAVDLGRREVIARQETPAQFQLTPDEEHEAEQLVVADGRIAAFLQGRPPNPLTRLYFPPGERADGTHRFAIVFLRPTNAERRYAVVDLTDERVVDVLGPEHLADG